eukprot:10197598-Alexandrium_andersonii.AAC.1
MAHCTCARACTNASECLRMPARLTASVERSWSVRQRARDCVAWVRMVTIILGDFSVASRTCLASAADNHGLLRA